MRLIDKAYSEREDDRETNVEQAFSPPNADKVVTEVDAILSEIGEGESIIQYKDNVITKYMKLNGKLFKEDTILEEV